MKESDPNSKERLLLIDKELAEIREKSNALKANWKREKELIARTRALKEKLEQLRIEEQAEERKGNLQRVAEIRYGLLRQTEEELNKLTAQMDGKGKTRMLKEEVDEEDVARIVSKWTGIPVSKMLEGEVKKLITMEDRLRQRVVGQDEALERVSNAIRRSRAGLSQVIEALKKQRFDVVLMDEEMPEMGGIEATLAIRKAELCLDAIKPSSASRETSRKKTKKNP